LGAATSANIAAVTDFEKCKLFAGSSEWNFYCWLSSLCSSWYFTWYVTTLSSFVYNIEKFSECL